MRRQPQLLHPQDEVGVDRARAAGEAAAGDGGGPPRANARARPAAAAGRVQADGAGARQGVVLGAAAPVEVDARRRWLRRLGGTPRAVK